MEEELPRMPSDLMAQLEKEDLDTWSREALEERIARMQAEIDRTKKAAEARSASRAAAEAFFN